jgi:hypothetical protein
LNPREVTIIPATKSDEPDRHLGTPGKIHVVGYAKVIKGTRAGVQIRKNIRRLIADKPKWELTFVTTDYHKTDKQNSTWHSFVSICNDIRLRYLDILIIDTANYLEDALDSAELLLPLCKEYGVVLYVLHNNMLLSESDFIL